MTKTNEIIENQGFPKTFPEATPAGQRNGGKKLSVVEAKSLSPKPLDLQEWGDIWEDFYDILVSRSRKAEETLAWSDLEAELD